MTEALDPSKFVTVRKFTPPKPSSLVTFYGEEQPSPPPWLVKGIAPQSQVAVLAGQYSSGKTFVAVDLAHAVMTGRPFIDCEVERQGGVLWLAAEGRSEIMVRLKGAALHATGQEQTGELPFAVQVGAVPALTSDDAFGQLSAIAEQTQATLAERFSTKLALIVIDTLNSAAGFLDENSASEAQRVFNTLRRLADATGALVLVVDHYGKAVETGVRGSSAKAGAADAILAILADKGIDGRITQRRLVVEKLRQAETGRTVPFTIAPVQVGDDDQTSAAINWKPNTIGQRAAATVKPTWSASASVLKLAIERAMIEHGQVIQPFGSEAAALRCVPVERVRTEFNASYAAESQDAKRKQFKRLWNDATAKGLVASRELGGSDWAWFVQSQPDMDEP